MDRNADLVRAFYHDVPVELRPKFDELVNHPLACPAHKMIDPAFSEVDSVYVYCEDDVCFLPADQRRVVDELKEMGVEFREVSLPSGHFPFLSMPEKLVDAIIDLA